MVNSFSEPLSVATTVGLRSSIKHIVNLKGSSFGKRIGNISNRSTLNSTRILNTKLQISTSRKLEQQLTSKNRKTLPDIIVEPTINR